MEGAPPLAQSELGGGRPPFLPSLPPSFSPSPTKERGNPTPTGKNLGCYNRYIASYCLDTGMVPGEFEHLPEYRGVYRNLPGSVWALIGLSGREEEAA